MICCDLCVRKLSRVEEVRGFCSSCDSSEDLVFFDSLLFEKQQIVKNKILLERLRDFIHHEIGLILPPGPLLRRISRLETVKELIKNKVTEPEIDVFVRTLFPDFTPGFQFIHDLLLAALAYVMSELGIHGPVLEMANLTCAELNVCRFAARFLTRETV